MGHEWITVRAGLEVLGEEAVAANDVRHTTPGFARAADPSSPAAGAALLKGGKIEDHRYRARYKPIYDAVI